MISESSEVGVRVERKARTRQALLDAAAALIREGGLSAATARAVSERAGVASGTFFVHFPEVSALVEELLDEHLERTLNRAYRTLAPQASLVDALVHVTDALFAGYAGEAELGRAFLTSSLFRAGDTGPTSARLTAFRTWVMERMIRARTVGELPPETDLEVVFTSFFCLYFGVLIAGLRGDMSRRRQKLVLRSTLNALVGSAS